jgi:predicted GH43/DUF377 family glycosyl hydrolase
MIWQKKGIIFKPEGQFGWINSHAQVPTALLKEKENILRIYFSSRPEPGKTLTTYADVDAQDPTKIIYLHNRPILELGKPGTFDQHGIMPSSVVNADGIIYLYYSGWSRSVGVPYNNFTGLAISEDGGNSFKKYSEAPILDRNHKELFSATSPCVLKEGKNWHMWYCSGTNWHLINDKFEHTYDIKYAHSSNGKNWTQTGIIAIKQLNEFEAVTKPAVIKIDGTYHMWYCYRGSKDFRDGEEGYKIGYATSSDAVNWTRKDKDAGITTSEKGWDSKMIAYPEVIRINNKLLLLYNGNHFGKDGFGYAELIINK